MLNSFQSLRSCLIIVSFSILLLSCKRTENDKNIEVITENYSLMVPNDLERTNQLNELAKVQFQKVDEDIYFIVLEEPKESFANAIRLNIQKSTPDLLGYFKVVTNHFNEINNNFKIDDFGRTKINSCDALIFSMSGESLDDGKSVFYRYALIEDEKNYYQIMSWTNLRFKEKLIGKMSEIIYSFKSKSNSN